MVFFKNLCIYSFKKNIDIIILNYNILGIEIFFIWFSVIVLLSFRS